MTTPSFLKNYADLYQQNPRTATLKWFSEARFGLFMHYGIYSQLGRGEWVMLREAIPVAEYVKLKDNFTAENFDADFITDLALEAGMNYINLTARHHDSFCLFKTAQNDYHSVSAPCGRDLIGELAEACDRKGLGVFFYYSYALDWKHPYFYPRDAGWDAARPDYPTPEPAYLFEKDEDMAQYIDFVHNQIRELLTQYGPIAGIWFDPIMGYYHRPDLFPIDETYALVRSLQPQCLISFKQGANGDEDFATPERNAFSLAHRLSGDSAEVAQQAWDANKDKYGELCDTMQPKIWGYNNQDSGAHRNADEVIQMLAYARSRNCNLLLNTGPLPDGSIDAEDADVLREVGARIRANGYPEDDNATYPEINYSGQTNDE
ncbi:MAG: alpha-L-fucosidase [Chloroflexota bacterium]